MNCIAEACLWPVVVLKREAFETSEGEHLGSYGIGARPALIQSTNDSRGML